MPQSMLTQPHIASRLLLCAGLGAVALFTGCLERGLVEVNPCLLRQVEEAVATDGIGRVDLLFVVDDSISMREEQALLREQFPRMIELLTTGQRPDGASFEPIKDLHVGVVSTNLGAPTTPPVSGCQVPGDDGRLLLEPNRANSPELTCPPIAALEPYLTYQQGQDAEAIVQAFQCIATLGTANAAVRTACPTTPTAWSTTRTAAPTRACAATRSKTCASCRAPLTWTAPPPGAAMTGRSRKTPPAGPTA